MGIINWFASILADPVYRIMILGTGLYILHIFLRGGASDVEKKFRALKGDLTTSFVIVMSTAILARYFIFVSEKSYFLLPDILSIIIAFVLTKRVRKFFGLR
jgi:hypothetical protein